MGLTVNGEVVPDAELAREAESLHTRFRQLSPEERQKNGFDDATMEQRAREWARENVIERTLLRQEARKDEEPVDETVFEKALEDAYRRFGGKEKFAESGNDEAVLRAEVETGVRLDRLIRTTGSKVKPPKPKDVAERYRKNRESYVLPERIRAAHIVKNVTESVGEEEARAAIDAAKAELDAGAVFEELADRVSDCPGNGGDLGLFPRGQMVEEFESVVFAMEPGEVSDVFRSVFGFHIATLREREPERMRPLAEASKEIAAEIMREKETKALEDFVDKLRETAAIEETLSTDEVVTGKS